MNTLPNLIIFSNNNEIKIYNTEKKKKIIINIEHEL